MVLPESSAMITVLKNHLTDGMQGSEISKVSMSTSLFLARVLGFNPMFANLSRETAGYYYFALWMVAGHLRSILHHLRIRMDISHLIHCKRAVIDSLQQAQHKLNFY
jgi:hypothetical protein